MSVRKPRDCPPSEVLQAFRDVVLRRRVAAAALEVLKASPPETVSEVLGRRSKPV